MALPGPHALSPARCPFPLPLPHLSIYLHPAALRVTLSPVPRVLGPEPYALTPAPLDAICPLRYTVGERRCCQGNSLAGSRMSLEWWVKSIHTSEKRATSKIERRIQ